MRQSSKNQRPARRNRRLWPRIVRWFVVSCLVLMGVAIGLFGGLYVSMSRMVPSSAGSLDYRPSNATEIYSSDGVRLARLYEENRTIVKLSEVPKHLQNATIAIEDKRFWSHPGFDARGIARAIWYNLRGRKFEQGASTITQQLARNVYLSQTKTLSRKLQEVALAVALERKFTKRQILEMYLNEVYYGSGAYGVESAARTYFGRPVGDLTLAQSALIAGLTQKPTSYSPFNNLSAAKGRRNLVLDYMAESGLISTDEAKQAKGESVDLAAAPSGLQWRAPYFVTHVLQQVGEEYGQAAVYRAGLRIYTTLDYTMQRAAEDAVRKGVSANRYRKVGQGALVSMDPGTGYIRAMVGGTDFKTNQFNVVTQGRPQAGSTFKPVVYAAALENGFKPTDRVRDEKVYLRGRHHEPWPKNYDYYRNRNITLTEAVAQSVNVVAVKVAKAVGLEEVIKYGRAMGITGHLPEDLTVALGSASIPPLDLARAYCCIANGGEAVHPVAITRITTADGGTLKTFAPVKSRVLSERTAEGLDQMLRSVVTSGTGRSVRYRIQAARGKTGTTDYDMHAWFIGYTPELVTAVWVGNDTPKPMREVWGGNVCAPIWTDFMRVGVVEQRAYLAKVNREPLDLDGYSSSSYGGSDDSPRRRRRARPARPAPAKDIQETADPDNDIGVPDSPPQDGVAPGPPPQPQPSEESIPAPEPAAARRTPSNRILASSSALAAPSQTATYSTVLVCAESGMIASSGCPHVVRKRFRTDIAPRRICGRH